MDNIENPELHAESEISVEEGHDMKNAEAQSVASVDKASDATGTAPARKGDKKNSEPSHLKPKTKAGMINAMYGKLNGMKKNDLQDAYGKVMGESVDLDDDFDDTTVESHHADLDALVESEATLSDEFKAKTAIIFEATLKSKLSEEVERIESAYQEKLAEETESHRSELVEKVDSYLNYVVEQWMEDNKVAIHNGLRTEIAENFMNGMKDLFVESYIDVPESKVDLVDDLADQVEELEEALNKTTADAIQMSEQIEELQREAIIAESVSDLADTQAEKFTKLVASLDFEDEEQFRGKVATVKESFFNQSVVSEEVEEDQLDQDAVDAVTEEVAPSMERYLTAIRNTQPK
jgi:hypothetical protein